MMADFITYDDMFDTGSSPEASRDAAMDFVDSFYKEPDQVSSVSDNLSELLDPNSDYMQTAQARSKSEREAQGYLESGFNTGVGTVAAIDKSFDAAMNNVYVEAFNVNEKNTAYDEQFKKAYEFASSAQVAQGELTNSELGYENFLDSMAKNQEYTQDLMQDEFTYSSILQDKAYNHLMDQEYLRGANAIANRIMRDKSGLQKFYLNQYSHIMMSDIDPEDKKAQLDSLGSNVDSITNEIVKNRTMKVDGSPYTINGIDYAEAYSPTDNGEAFVWSVNDADWVWNKDAKAVIKDLIDQIYAQTNGAQRDQYDQWYQVNDVIWIEFPQLRSKDPQAYKDIMQWFNKTAKYQLQDDWKGVINKWANATRYYPSRPPPQVFIPPEDYEYFEGERIIPPISYTVWGVNSDKTDIVQTQKEVPGNQAYYDREAYRLEHPLWMIG